MAETLKETLEETNAELETVEVEETEEKQLLQQIQVFQDVKSRTYYLEPRRTNRDRSGRFAP